MATRRRLERGRFAPPGRGVSHSGLSVTRFFGNDERGSVSTTWAGKDDGLSADTSPERVMPNRVVAWAFGQPEPDGRAPNRALLEPGEGRWRLDRCPALPENLHPAVAAAVALVGCVILTAAVMIVFGLLMVHFGAHDRLGHWDEHVNQWFAAHRVALLDRLSGDFTVLADTTGIVAVATVVTVLLLLRRWGRFAWLLAAGLAVELTVFLASNYTVRRPRPSVVHVGSTPSTSSWPSGHVAATTVLYGGIAVLVMVATSRRLPRLAGWALALALIACVALSRIYRGEHHPIDTIAGLALGAAALYSAIFAVRVWNGHRGRPAPGGSPPTLMKSNPGAP
jgi:membrane-associated phospholipid phosphatase